jgi:hypothetical protein
MDTIRRTGWLLLMTVLTAPQTEMRAQQANPRPGAGSARESETAPQDKFRRLVLKDGSYELIRRYEIKGDRVLYLSSERHEWEEVPYANVDWPATEKYAQESASATRSRLRQLGESEAEARDRRESLSPLIMPGLRLPDTGGVFLLDRFQGKPELSPMHQNGAEINRNISGNILRAVINPVSSVKQVIELKGPHARIQSHVTDPSIYVSLDPDDSAAGYTPETASDHFRIARCEEKKGNRLVGALNIAIYGKVKQQADYLETKVEPVSGRWIRVRPATPLQQGEYALVELLGKNINTYVWDFGVNPTAEANTAARQPEPERQSEPPVLLKRRSGDRLLNSPN